MHPDVIIAGGGPAGLVAALHAVAAGLSVQVHEPRPGVVDKACGEGVMPAGVAHLHRLGIHPDGQEFVGVRYCAPGDRKSTRLNSSHVAISYAVFCLKKNKTTTVHSLL